MPSFDTHLVWEIAALVIAAALAAIAFSWRYRRKKEHNEDALQTLGFTLVVLGVIFGEDQIIGYSFIGVGVLLSVVTLIARRRRSKI